MENTKLNKKQKCLKKQGYLPKLNPIPQDIYDTELIIPCNIIDNEKPGRVRYFFCTTLGQSIHYEDDMNFLKTDYYTNMYATKSFPIPQEYDLYSISAIFTGSKEDVKKIKESKTSLLFYLGNNPYATIPIDMLFEYSDRKNGYSLMLEDANKPTHINQSETFYAKYYYDSNLNIKKPVYMKIIMHGILYREIR